MNGPQTPGATFWEEHLVTRQLKMHLEAAKPPATSLPEEIEALENLIYQIKHLECLEAIYSREFILPWQNWIIWCFHLLILWCK